MHSRRTLPTQRSAIAFARGERTGVLITRAPGETNTPSNAAVDFGSRSLMRNLTCPARSPRSMTGDHLRKGWVRSHLDREPLDRSHRDRLLSRYGVTMCPSGLKPLPHAHPHHGETVSIGGDQAWVNGVFPFGPTVHHAPLNTLVVTAPSRIWPHFWWRSSVSTSSRSSSVA